MAVTLTVPETRANLADQHSSTGGALPTERANGEPLVPNEDVCFDRTGETLTAYVWMNSSGGGSQWVAAWTATVPANVQLGQATETDVARGLTVVQEQFVTLGQASETDLARALTVVQEQFVALGKATETDVARALTVLGAETVALGKATETDVARALTVLNPRTYALGRATETDVARGLTVDTGGTATVAVTDFAAGARSGTTITLTASGTPSAGDIEILWLSAVNMSWSIPAGWVKMFSQDVDNDDDVEAWGRVCTGGESATTTLTVTDLGSDAAAAVMVRVSDAEAMMATFKEVSLSGSTVTAQDCGVAYDDSLVLRGYTALPSASAWTAPTGHTEVVDDQDSATSDSTVTVMEQDALQSAGSVSTQGADLVSTSGPSQFAGLTVTLSPPQSGVRVVGAIKTEEQGTFPIPVKLPPTVQDGDVLLMMIATRNAETPSTPPTGWTELQRTGLTSGGLTSAASTNEHAAVYTKVASSETGSVSVGVTDNGTESVIIDVVAIRGASGVDDSSLGNGGVAPSVSGVSGGILVGWWGTGFGSFGVSPPSGMIPAPREETADNGASSIAAFEKLTATGATGTRDIGVNPDFDAAVLIAVS